MAFHSAHYLDTVGTRCGSSPPSLEPMESCLGKGAPGFQARLWMCLKLNPCGSLVPLLGSGSLVEGSIGLAQTWMPDIVCNPLLIGEIAAALVVLVDTAVEEVADMAVEVADIAVGTGIVDQVWTPEMLLLLAHMLLELWRDISQIDSARLDWLVEWMFGLGNLGRELVELFVHLCV